MVCDYFEQRGHATIRSHPTTTEGYVHSLGHGVGLDIHEKPGFALSAMNSDVIEVGDVITIEAEDPDRRLAGLYADADGWARKVIMNLAGSGRFSSDRTIAEYAAEIWQVGPCPVP